MNNSVFIDVSGSVGNNSRYWEEVAKIINSNTFKSYYLWDTNIVRATKQEVMNAIKEMTGRGGTSISEVAKTIVKNNHQNDVCYIITDGDVGSDEVKRSEAILSDTIIQNVKCFIISRSATEKSMDISVPLAFMRRNNATLYLSNSVDSLKVIKELSVADYELLNNITLDNVLKHFDKIYDLVNISNMNKAGLPDIKQKLIKIRSEFIKLSGEKLKAIDGKMVQEYLLKGDYDEATRLLKIIEYNFTNVDDDNASVKFNKLLSLCDDRRNTGFALATKISNANLQDEVKPEEEVIVSTFEDPILMVPDTPQILILDTDVVLFEDDKSFKNFIENPLGCLDDEELKNKIARKIGHCLGVSFTNAYYEDPFNRGAIIGTIPLTESNDQHITVGNYALYKLFTNGKKMGNVNLYYVVLYQILVVEKRCEYLEEYYEFITNHLKYRMANATTYISLCGLPDFNRTLVPMDVAMYYIINGPEINKNILRKHLFSIDVMTNIITNVFKYSIDGKITKHINLEKIAMSMLKCIKKNAMKFRTIMKCLVNSYITTENKVMIPIDNEATDDDVAKIIDKLPVYYKDLPKNELLYISTLVNPNYSASNINIAYNQPITYTQPFVRDWGYDVKNVKPLDISLKTFRIYYKENWKDLAEENAKVSVDKQCSSYNDYIKYYLKNKKFPTYDEFATHTYNRYKKALHKDFKNIYDEIYAAYQNVRDYIEQNNLTYEDVKKIISDSCRIIDRVRIQDS